MTQIDRVVDYLEKHGSITTYDSYSKLGVTRLSAVIYTLKDMGYVFDECREHKINRFGGKCTYKRYILNKELSK